MKAIGYQHSLPIEDKNALQDIELEIPKASGHDILVEVQAVSVNPVDYKIRQRVAPEQGEWKILGWDAAASSKRPAKKQLCLNPAIRSGTPAT